MSRKRKRRRLLLLAALIAAVILGRWLVAPWAIERTLISQIERRLKGRVSIQDLSFSVLEGWVTVHGLSYRDPSGRPVFSIRACNSRFSLHRVLMGQILPDRLDVEGGRLYLSLSPEGSNVEDNYRAESEATGDAEPPQLPQLVFKNCEIVFDAPRALRRNLLIHVNGEMLPSGLRDGSAQVQLTLKVMPVGKDTENEEALEPIRLVGAFNARTTAFKLSTDSEGVHLAPAIRELLHPALAEKGWDWLNPVGAVRLEVDGDFYRRDGLPNYRFSLYNARGLGICFEDFPYAVQDVQGVSLLLPGEPERRGRLSFENLRGTHGRAIATVNGQVYGYLEADREPWAHLVLEGRDVPLDEDLKYALEHVDPKFGQIWEAVNPAGTADFQCLLFKDNLETRVHASLTASVRNGKFNYLGFVSEGTGSREGFPYPLSQVSGTFESHLGYTRFEFRGRGSGRSDLHVSGEVRADPEEAGRPALDVHIQGKDVPLDDALRQAMLDFRGDRLWKELQPDGFADIYVHLLQQRTGEPLDFDVVIELKGRATFVYEILPTQLTDLWGTIRFKSGWQFPRLQRIHGKVNVGDFQVEGTLTPSTRDQLRISLGGPFLAPQVTRALTRSPNPRLREVGKILDLYDPIGEGEATIVLQGLGDIRSRFDFAFKGAKAVGPALPLELSNLSGKIEYDGTYVWLRDVVGWHDGGWVEVQGERRLAKDAPHQWLKVSGQNLPLARLRVPTVGPFLEMAPILRKYNPRGMLRTLELETDSRDPETSPNIIMSLGNVELLPASTLMSDEPLDNPKQCRIRLDRGLVHYNPAEGLKVNKAEGTIGKTLFSDLFLHRQWLPEEQVVRLSAEVERLDLKCPVYTLIGKKVVDAIAHFESSGSFNVTPLAFEIRVPDKGGPTVRFLATERKQPTKVDFDSFSIRVGPFVREVTGTMTIDPDSVLGAGARNHLTGDLGGISLRMFGMQVEDLYGRVVLEGETRGDTELNFLRLSEMKGDFYGGELGPDCDLELMLTGLFPFQGNIVARDVQIRRLIDDVTEHRAATTNISGLLTGRFHFFADESKLDALVGVGRGEVRQGKFGSIPAFVTLLNYFSDHFHGLQTDHLEVVGRKVYLGTSGHIKQDNPVLENLPRTEREPYFQAIGDALNLRGSGWISFGGEMEFKFQPRDIWLSTPIPGIKQVLDLLLRQTGTIYVLGTIERINVEPILFGIGTPNKGDKQPLRIPDQPLIPAERW
jgi:hypothetical protein